MRIVLPILFILTLGLSSCVSISTPTSVNTTPLIITSTLPATSTSYASPTSLTPATVPVTAAPGVTSAPCRDSAVLLADVTIPDGTNVPAGSKFTKTWQFENNGTCNWSNYTINYASGDRMSAPDSAPVPSTNARTNVNISVDLVAPASDGDYTGFFELRNANGQPLPIGTEKNFWVKITVGALTTPTPAPTAAVTPPPGAVTGTPVSQNGGANCKYIASASSINEIATLINKARADAGLTTLTIDTQLTSAAQGHSTDMACTGPIVHTGSDGSSPATRVNAAGYTGTFREEIIYAGGYPQDAYNWWMNDQVHHDAILDPKNTEMGVGYAYVSTSTYGGYFTVDFGSR
jgi:uncharacterized protein YkwD